MWQARCLNGCGKHTVLTAIQKTISASLVSLLCCLSVYEFTGLKKLYPTKKYFITLTIKVLEVTFRIYIRSTSDLTGSELCCTLLIKSNAS